MEVGTVVVFEPSDSRYKPREIVVTKIARKWVSCGVHTRFDRDTMIVDGGKYSSPGRVWLRWDDLHAEQYRRNRQALLRAKVTECGREFTIEQIEIALGALLEEPRHD